MYSLMTPISPRQFVCLPAIFLLMIESVLATSSKEISRSEDVLLRLGTMDIPLLFLFIGTKLLILSDARCYSPVLCLSSLLILPKDLWTGSLRDWILNTWMPSPNMSCPGSAARCSVSFWGCRGGLFLKIDGKFIQNTITNNTNNITSHPITFPLFASVAALRFGHLRYDAELGLQYHDLIVQIVDELVNVHHLLLGEICNPNSRQCIGWRWPAFRDGGYILFCSGRCSSPWHLDLIDFGLLLLDCIDTGTMTIPVTIVCMLLVSASVCQQTGPEQTQYLNQLVGIQSRLLGQVDELLSLVQQVNTNVSVVRGYAGLEQSALEAGIVLQRGKILSMQLPTSTMCNQMAEEQKKQLLGRIAQTQVNLKTITNKLKMQPSCPRNQQISLQAGLLTRYLTSTKSSISNTCKSTPTSTPAKTVLIPYANNSYYIYGAQTQQNYQANLQNLLKQGYIQQQCPAESPFPKGNQCASCPADRVHYYDLTLLRCLTCPQSYVYVPGKHICIQQVNMTSPQVINYVGEMPAPEGEQPVQYCPVERPYYDGRQCVACGLPGYFDMSAHRCLSCPEGQSFDLKNKKCGRVSYNSNINQKSINYCCGQMPHQPNIQSCPAQSPFYDGTNCIACPLPKYFNLQTLSCVLCPEGEQFSTRQRKCMSNKYKQLVYVSNINENVTNYQGNPANTDQYQLVGTCPKDRPFSTLNECIACEQPYFFNFQALQCQNCPSQTAFDKRIHKCLPTTTVTAIQKYNTNTQAIRDYIGAQPQYDSQLPMCPSEHPLFDGSQCVTCPPNFHVDYDRLKCVGCPSGYIFSPAGHQCLAGSPLYYTDLSSNRIYYHPGDYESMLTLIQKQRAEIPGIRACPPEKPFFDQANRLCIDCPAEFPYFDVKYNRCIDCGKGSRFDESIGGCRGH